MPGVRPAYLPIYATAAAHREATAGKTTLARAGLLVAWRVRYGYFPNALATEPEIDHLFQDCAHGAVPPIGECYGLDVIVDDSIAGQPEVYMEGGDHATLIHINQPQFARVMAEARHGRFSIHDGYALSATVLIRSLPFASSTLLSFTRRGTHSLRHCASPLSIPALIDGGRRRS